MDLFVRQRLLVGIRRLTRCGVCKLFGWPALVTLVGLVVLSSLGTWQIYRLHWKRDLINLIETRLSRPPQKIETIQVRDLMPSALQELEFQKVKAEGVFLADQALKLQGRTHEGRIGYHLIIPLRLEGGATVLIDRGWVPLNESKESFFSQDPAKKVSIQGYIRLKTESNFMTPENRYQEREIYALDPIEVSKSLEMITLLPFYVVQTGMTEKASFPVPAKSHISLRNFHLQYAITWYSLALLLGMIYILYVRRQSESY